MTEVCLEKLQNGLRFVTVKMPDRDSASVAIWVKAGARSESNKISGVSHFLEHMLFKGTKKRTARQIKEAIEGVGGVLNAFTGEESTCYFAKLLVEHVPTALEVLSDMVNHATLSPQEIQKERTVILEEIKMYKDLPSHLVHDMMGELLWPDQPLGRAISGTVESVSALTRAQMQDYKKRFYHPKNILVSVSGSVNHEVLKSQVEKIFSMKSSGSETQFAKAVAHQRRPQSRFLEKATEQTHFVIGFRGVSRFHPERYPLGIMNVILGANMSSRLFEEVREKRGLAYEIRSSCGFYQDTGYMSVSAGVETKKAPKAIEVVLKELEKISKRGITAGELSRAKDYFMSQLCMALEDTLDHLLWVGERVIDGGEVPSAKKIREKIEAVSLKEVQAIAKKIFVSENLNLSLIGPVKEKTQNEIKRNLSF